MRLLGTGRLADQVSDLLDTEAGGLVIVAGDNKLAAALAARGREVAVAAGDARAVAKVALEAMLFDDHDRLALETDSIGGAVIAGATRDESPASWLAELTRVVAPGGVVVLLDKAARTRASQTALLAGLTRLQQRVVARTVVTAGVVPRV